VVLQARSGLGHTPGVAPGADATTFAGAKRVKNAFASFGLAGFGHRDPETLSGRQRRRVVRVRLILSRPLTPGYPAG